MSFSVNNFAASRRESNLRKHLSVRTISRSVDCPVGFPGLVAGTAFRQCVELVCFFPAPAIWRLSSIACQDVADLCHMHSGFIMWTDIHLEHKGNRSLLMSI